MLSVSAEIMATPAQSVITNRFVFNRLRNGYLDAFSIAPEVAAHIITAKEPIDKKGEGKWKTTP
jgi:hypothetical protein